MRAAPYLLLEEKRLLFVTLQYRDGLDLTNMLAVVFQEDLRACRKAVIEAKLARNTDSRSVEELGRRRVHVTANVGS